MCLKFLMEALHCPSKFGHNRCNDVEMYEEQTNRHCYYALVYYIDVER